MAKPIVLCADSTCDLSPELIEKYQVKIIPMHVNLEENSYLDGVDIDADAIYAYYREHKVLPKTAALNMDECVSEQNSLRIKTGMLNDVLAQATARVQPPTDKGKRLRIYYMTQPSTNPPTFVFFVNRAELFHFSYQRYLENQLRETFGLEGTPVRFIIREKGDRTTQ